MNDLIYLTLLVVTSFLGLVAFSSNSGISRLFYLQITFFYLALAASHFFQHIPSAKSLTWIIVSFISLISLGYEFYLFKKLNIYTIIVGATIFAAMVLSVANIWN